MLKKILYTVLGALLALLALILLASFIFYRATPRPLFDANPMPTVGYVLWVLSIFGSGVTAFFFLRAAVREFIGYDDIAADDQEAEDEEFDEVNGAELEDDEDRGDYD